MARAASLSALMRAMAAPSLTADAVRSAAKLARASAASAVPPASGKQTGSTPAGLEQTVPTRILGIDPGLRVTGFGIIERRGQKLHYVSSGVIRTTDGDLPSRLKTIFDGVRELAQQFQPDCAAVEKVFVNVNPQSTLLLGQARGAALCGLVSTDLAVAEYTALQLKQAVVGNGRARKEQVQEMVARLLGLDGLPGTDAADALGVAICHAHASGILGQLGGFAPQLSRKGVRVRRGRLVG